MILITSENPFQSGKLYIKNLYIYKIVFFPDYYLMLILEKIMSHEILTDNNFRITLDWWRQVEKDTYSLFLPLLVIDETLKTFIILVQVNFNLILDFRI